MQVANLSKAFHSPAGKTIQVLRDVSFSIADAEMVAIMGASGAGKTTLLHIIGGLEPPDGGSIRWDRASNNPPRVSFVFQFHYLLPDLTALENVSLPLLIARRQQQKSCDRAAAALEAIGLADRVSHKIGYLSGGEQQRVAVARALVTEPRLVLADEPTGNLDASITEEIGVLLKKYCHEQQAKVIVATHNEQLAQLCDRRLLLQDGLILEH
jgi:lipoprotein-releasing system ATP-binding protein